MSFVDRTSITLASGCGGRGAVHFQRLRHSPRGGPDGGDGGDGGDIVLSVNTSLKDFSHITKHRLYKAEDGKPGGGRKKKGARGKDLVLYVPQGTICYSSTGQFLKELTDKDWCFLKGGKGGKGNHFFKNARLQAPHIAQVGKPALQSKVVFQLKWLSDVCFIGFRSSGKTSFVLNLNRRQEKIYPSVYPRLFSIQSEEFTPPVLLVDLPGLSSSTRVFLKQAERTKIIVFVVSLMDENPFYSYQKLKKEILTYDQKQGSNLTQKPAFLLLTGKKNSMCIEKKEAFLKYKVMNSYFFINGFIDQSEKLMNEVLKRVKM